MSFTKLFFVRLAIAAAVSWSYYYVVFTKLMLWPGDGNNLVAFIASFMSGMLTVWVGFDTPGRIIRSGQQTLLFVSQVATVAVTGWLTLSSINPEPGESIKILGIVTLGLLIGVLAVPVLEKYLLEVILFVISSSVAVVAAFLTIFLTSGKEVYWLWAAVGVVGLVWGLLKEKYNGLDFYQGLVWWFAASFLFSTIALTASELKEAAKNSISAWSSLILPILGAFFVGHLLSMLVVAEVRTQRLRRANR